MKRRRKATPAAASAPLRVPAAPLHAHEPAVLDPRQRRQIAHPLHLAGAHRHLLRAGRRVAGAGVSGVRVRRLAGQRHQAADRLVPVHQEVGRVERHRQTAGVVPVQVVPRRLARVRSGFEADGHAGAVAVPAQVEQRFPQCHGTGRRGTERERGLLLGRRVDRYAGHRHHHLPRPQVERQLHRLPHVFEPLLLVVERVQPVPQRAADRCQFQVERAEEGAELAAAGVAQAIRGEVADGIHLHAAGARPRRRGQRLPHRQAERLEHHTEFDLAHGGSMRRVHHGVTGNTEVGADEMPPSGRRGTLADRA